MKTQTQQLLSVVGAVCAACASLSGQELERRHHLSVGGGAGIPGGDLRPYMSTASLFRVSYAYRFHGNLQAETGLDLLFGAAHVSRTEPSALGDIKISDTEFMVPFGLRAVAPLAKNRFELSAGGGGTFIGYGEGASLPEGVRIYCPNGPCFVNLDCATCKSRKGWGYYGIAGASFALDSRRRVWLSFTTRFVRATTGGSALGAIPGFQTKDQWLTTAVEIVGRF